MEPDDPTGPRLVVIVASKGRWNKAKEQNEYKLKLKVEGTDFEGGDWIVEKRLNARPT